MMSEANAVRFTPGDIARCTFVFRGPMQSDWGPLTESEFRSLVPSVPETCDSVQAAWYAMEAELLWMYPEHADLLRGTADRGMASGIMGGAAHSWYMDDPCGREVLHSWPFRHLELAKSKVSAGDGGTA